MHPRLYLKPKRITVQDARLTERIEHQRRFELERKRKMLHQEWLHAIVQHHHDFKEFHRTCKSSRIKLKQKLTQWHANEEMRQKREEERRERERMRRLMEEDEDGYRRLIDEKKHKRLAHLLKQTDEYVDSLTQAVREHRVQMSRKREKLSMQSAAATTVPAVPPGTDDDNSQDSTSSLNDDTSQSSDAPVAVLETSSGHILTGEKAPRASDLERWLKDHPGWELAPNQDDESMQDKVPADEDAGDASQGASARKPNNNKEEEPAAIIEAAKAKDVPIDEYEQAPDKGPGLLGYYQLAHSVREEVKEQPPSLKFGQLKEYQIQGLVIETFFMLVELLR